MCRRWPFPCCGTASSCDRRPSSRASPLTRSCAASCSRSRFRSNGMAISGWFVALVAFGALPVIVTGQPVVLALWLVLVVALGVLDLVLAGSPRAVVLSRDLPWRVRLGETV